MCITVNILIIHSLYVVESCNFYRCPIIHEINIIALNFLALSHRIADSLPDAEALCQTRDKLPIDIIFSDIVGLSQFRHSVGNGYGKFRYSSNIWSIPTTLRPCLWWMTKIFIVLFLLFLDLIFHIFVLSLLSV